MKKFLRIFLYKIFPKLKKGASILMYHSVGENNAFFTVTPENFEKQINYLNNSGFKILSFSKLVEMFLNKEDISSCVSLTFDDGYLDNLENALPILRKFNMKATIFTIPGFLGKTFTTSDGVTLKVFREEQFKNLNASDVFEILPHSFNHKELIDLDKEEIKKELSDSFEFLNYKFVTKKILAYPRGKYSDSVIKVLSEESWLAGATTLPGLLTLNSNRFLIPRNFVGRFTSIREFKTFFSDGVYYYSKLKSCFSGLLKKF